MQSPKSKPETETREQKSVDKIGLMANLPFELIKDESGQDLTEYTLLMAFGARCCGTLYGSGPQRQRNLDDSEYAAHCG